MYLDNDPKAHPKPEHREGAACARHRTADCETAVGYVSVAAVGSMGLSLALELMGEEKKANFVGHWAPTLLIFGLYNKLVKLQGSDGV
jgi:hypothetical protein